MCPIFRMNPREEASPRAKANVVRGLISGNLPTDTLLQDVCKEVADLCVHCHMCRLECPTNVDIPSSGSSGGVIPGIGIIAGTRYPRFGGEGPFAEEGARLPVAHGRTGDVTRASAAPVILALVAAAGAPSCKRTPMASDAQCEKLLDRFIDLMEEQRQPDSQKTSQSEEAK